jgi:hypothetical protein
MEGALKGSSEAGLASATFLAKDGVARFMEQLQGDSHALLDTRSSAGVHLDRETSHWVSQQSASAVKKTGIVFSIVCEES